MNIMKQIKRKISQGGIKYATVMLLRRLFQDMYLAITKLLFIWVKISNVIVIESHNDFDCNGGAFYNYLLKNSLNDKWTIVWLVRNDIPASLPANVLAFNYWRKSLKKEYYIHKAKYILVDDKFIQKRNRKQIEIYCQHGLSIKNVKGSINAPQYIDYILSSSKNYDKMLCYNISVPYPNSKMLHFGYPYNDVFFENTENEVKKISRKQYSKTFLWMPTFRKKNEHRNDSKANLPLGIPLIMSDEDLDDLNKYLFDIDCLLIIKIHPMQYKESYKDLHSLSNIIVIDGHDVKQMNIDNYRLMKSCDGLISDYSSSAYSYLLLNRPIGFVLSDLEDYKIGFSVDNPDDYLPGERIYTLEDFERFIDNVYSGTDIYFSKRQALKEYLYEYADGNSCKRIADFLNIE